MKIGRYRIGYKSPEKLLTPLLMWVIVGVFLYESKGLWDDNAMLLVRWCTYVMIVLTLIVLAQGISIKKAEEAPEEVKERKSFTVTAEGKKLAVYILSLVAYLILMKYLGFIVSTLLFIAGLTYYLGERKISNLILVPVCLTAGIYLMFDVWLHYTLPVGFLGF